MIASRHAAVFLIVICASQSGCRTEEAVGSERAEVSGAVSPSQTPQSSPTDGDSNSVSEVVEATVPSKSVELEDPPVIEPRPGRIVELDGGVRAWVGRGRVEFPGMISLDQGWLEVAVCRRGSREHESIVVTDAVPSVVHAAMLLAGLTPGRPATYDEATRLPIPPEGPVISIELRFASPESDGDDAATLPLVSVFEDARASVSPIWVFAGSLVRPNPQSMGPGEYYAADYAGTVVGLSTFGDEVVAVEEVRSPESGVDPPVWRIKQGVLPEIDTPVTVVLRGSARPE
ncbi:MAG: YdjY domain-containing protein [Phycisphaerales bacterium]|nr:YdjY domain-containing protein [Phycisphaerales bacterium]